MSAKYYVAMTRPVNSALSGAGALFAVMVYSNYSVTSTPLLLCAFTTGYFLTASAMLINDVVDLEVDRVNKPWKPLPSGKASPRTALALAVLLFIAGVLCNLAVSIWTLLVALTYGSIGVLYSYLRKHWWSSKLVAFSTTGPVIYGYTVAGFPTDTRVFTVIFALSIFLVTLGREVLKSIQDYRGDLVKGYKTIATVYGLNTAYRAMLLVGVLGALLALSTTALQVVSTPYKALISLAAVVYVSSIARAYINRETTQLEKQRKRTLHAMVIGTVAFWLSKLPL
ncbi:MAG: geranylgeranylglycerol-phosphate geranylgeranyltransferase [Desulfurococcaceae archaeon]